MELFISATHTYRCTHFLNYGSGNISTGKEKKKHKTRGEKGVTSGGGAFKPLSLAYEKDLACYCLSRFVICWIILLPTHQTHTSRHQQHSSEGSFHRDWSFLFFLLFLRGGEWGSSLMLEGGAAWDFLCVNLAANCPWAQPIPPLTPSASIPTTEERMGWDWGHRKRDLPRPAIMNNHHPQRSGRGQRGANVCENTPRHWHYSSRTLAFCDEGCYYYYFHIMPY